MWPTARKRNAVGPILWRYTSVFSTSCIHAKGVFDGKRKIFLECGRDQNAAKAFHRNKTERCSRQRAWRRTHDRFRCDVAAERYPRRHGGTAADGAALYAAGEKPARGRSPKSCKQDGKETCCVGGGSSIGGCLPHLRGQPSRLHIKPTRKST